MTLSIVILSNLNHEAKGRDSGHWKETGKNDRQSSILSPGQSNASPKRLIVIDPGHGTRNSRLGVKKEAYYNLILAQRIKRVLEKSDVKVILTHSFLGQDLGAKNPDEDNKLRARIANANKATLFLRIHFDSARNNAAIYYPRLHPDKEIAEKSKKAAYFIWKYLERNLPKETRKGGVLEDGKTEIGKKNEGLLVGSKFSRVPVVCVEVLPLDSHMRNWIKRRKHLETIALAITQGILDYLKTLGYR